MTWDSPGGGPCGGERRAVRAQPRARSLSRGPCGEEEEDICFLGVSAGCVKGSSMEGQGRESPRLLAKAEQELGLWPVGSREPHTEGSRAVGPWSGYPGEIAHLRPAP